MISDPLIEPLHAADGCGRIWLAVLQAAVEDFMGATPREEFGITDAGNSLLTDQEWAAFRAWAPLDAAKWLHSDVETPGSFRFVCVALGLDYEELRKVLFARKRRTG